MTRIVVDADLRNKLLDLIQPLELCDEAGCVLASVCPSADHLSQYGPLEPQVSEEELDRRQYQETESYTTEEVLAYLKNLEKQ